MAKEPPQTVGDLRRKAVITDKEISAATDAFLLDRKATPYQFASGHVLDVAAAVEAHRPAKAALVEKTIPDALRRTMVRTAVILATPDGGQ
jgi:hypothetical protein